MQQTLAEWEAMLKTQTHAQNGVLSKFEIRKQSKLCMNQEKNEGKYDHIGGQKVNHHLNIIIYTCIIHKEKELQIFTIGQTC